MNDTITKLAENQYVTDLFGVLRENGKDTSGLSALLDHVNDMENFVKLAEDKIAVMKSQLDDMREIQSHPVKNALKNAIKSLKTTVAAVKAQITELKSGIVEGCKRAMAAFKDGGITALDELSSFFNVKSGLQAIKNNTVKGVSECDKAVDRIASFAKEYHSAGRAFKSMALVAVGKKPIDTQKEAGRLAQAVSAPYRTHKKCLLSIRGAVNEALFKMDQLENKAAAIHSKRGLIKKPSMLERLEANKARVEREKRILPVPQRNLAQGIEV